MNYFKKPKSDFFSEYKIRKERTMLIVSRKKTNELLFTILDVCELEEAIPLVKCLLNSNVDVFNHYYLIADLKKKFKNKQKSKFRKKYKKNYFFLALLAIEIFISQVLVEFNYYPRNLDSKKNLKKKRNTKDCAKNTYSSTQIKKSKKQNNFEQKHMKAA